MKKIINGKILTPDPLPENYEVLIEGNIIKAISHKDQRLSGIPSIDAGGNWVIPGLIDIHIHGSAGFDIMDEDPQSLPGIAHFLASRGITSFLPTTVAASNTDILKIVERMEGYQQTLPGARILGIHLEGPYLRAAYRGAQPEEYLRTAQPQEYQAWLDSGLVKLMTIAPEVDGVLELISAGVKKGIHFAVGHSSAPYETVIEAVNRGLNQATHTFNAMPPLHHREPGVVGAVLTDDRIYAQVIADGIHLHPAIVKLIFRSKGVKKTILITDAIQAAGAKDGYHKLGKQTVLVQNGIARTETGALAGSTLFLNDAIKNSAAFTGIPWMEILLSATSVPAQSLGLENQIGSLKQGALADLVIMDDALSPVLTMVGGEIVYKKLGLNRE